MRHSPDDSMSVSHRSVKSLLTRLWLAFLSIDFTSSPTALDKFTVLFTGTNGVLIAALLSTFGMYILSSCLWLEPWHLITSFVQVGLTPFFTSTESVLIEVEKYLLIGPPAFFFSGHKSLFGLPRPAVPSFTNILNVYSFSNLNDVSWGTKGSDAAVEALPSVVSSKDGEKDAGISETVRTGADLEDAFQETVQRALKPHKTVEHQSAPTRDDSNRVRDMSPLRQPLPDCGNQTFRTRLVAVWLLTNGALTAWQGHVWSMI